MSWLPAISNLRLLENRGREANLAGKLEGLQGELAEKAVAEKEKGGCRAFTQEVMRLGESYFPRVVVLSPCWSYRPLRELLETLMPKHRAYRFSHWLV